MGCCLSLLELRFLQSEYTRIPDEIYTQPYNENKKITLVLPRRLQRSVSAEIGQYSQGNCKIPLRNVTFVLLTIVFYSFLLLVGEFSLKYVFLEDLGQGAYSTVKLGLEIGTDHKVAVKIINKIKLGKGLNLTNLLSEITALSQCDHENIIKLYNVYDESPNYYLVTEYVPGGELFDCIIRRTYYSEGSARKLIKQVLVALNYLHNEVGVVHRDIKPENILLTTGDDHAIVKLADFGFAANVGKLTDNEVPLGTPAYVAPEIVRGDPYRTEVDIWSLGVVSYILLCGCPPFQEESSKIFDQIRAGSYDFHEDHWSRISPSAVDLVSRMLVVDQKERWTAKQLLSHPWILSYQSTLPSLDGTLKHLRRYTARRKLRAVAQVVIVANRMKKFTSGREELRRYQEKHANELHRLPTLESQEADCIPHHHVKDSHNETREDQDGEVEESSIGIVSEANEEKD